MTAGSTLRQPIPAGWNAFVYTISGEARYGADDAKAAVGAHETVILTVEGDGLLVVAKDSAAEFVLISGKPIGEPIVQHGPFVMTSDAEIRTAIMDYQMGRNGFERAPGWRSEIGKRLTEAGGGDDDDY